MPYKEKSSVEIAILWKKCTIKKSKTQALYSLLTGGSWPHREAQHRTGGSLGIPKRTPGYGVWASGYAATAGGRGGRKARSGRAVRLDTASGGTAPDGPDAARHRGLTGYITVLKHFKKIVTAIGIPETRFHDLRHTYATNSIRLGDPIKTVSENLGHATVAFTLDVYGHVTPVMKKESAERMQRLIDSL